MGAIEGTAAPARGAGGKAGEAAPAWRRRLGPTLAASVILAVAPARANPLTEAPGTRTPAAEAEAPPARDEAAEQAEAGAVNPSANAIICSLAPFADGNPGRPAAPVAVSPGDGGPSLRVDPARSVDLTVFFAYDSARLTPKARVQLEPLGQALQSRDLAAHGFLIAGHTDAAGGLGYNRRLSLARARAVKAHLAEAYGIDPRRLRIHGWGPSRPKDPAQPLARINRRVEVSLIVPLRSGALRFVLPAAAEGCGANGLGDPRRRLPLDLDDFDAAPTPLPCTE
ncbi:OmpA family protein [Methylobacterium sp. AMS5]|uniref:OmpA family protein n=1 Tax=Methylobacterium sp. AMS5 TaxID=925818 RepID=UPI00074F9CDF|nr:OmpA family protein [Methylobacterium sp. AMS5]AMB43830.1 membrane protein [Methylobacterium sp. AMS5]